jgi:hypothetical protein
MKRRKFIRNTLGFGMAFQPLMSFFAIQPQQERLPKVYSFSATGPRFPVTVYDNWSAYDELSDNIPLTEELAMGELNELIRLKKNGVHVDYYVMDAFWFDKNGGYRKWHQQNWPDGPDRWLKACKENNIKPGMWFSTNLIATQRGRFLEVIPEWQNSLATDPNIMCLFSGGYLNHLEESLQIWYDKGVRLFKFDFAYFSAATAAAKKVHLPSEIEEMNKLAFMDMLKQFRIKNPDVLITGYNGFGGDMENSFTEFRKTVDSRWLEVFDTLYCGDPRISDVPAMNIWRSQDIYSDHMVRQFEFNGLPLQRIDNCGFMIGKTGTCYYRATNAWKGMLILELARGGWLNVYHGNLELLTEEDAKWFSKTQSLYRQLQQFSIESSFGAIPGSGKPYGFRAESNNGNVFTVVNPSQAVVEIELAAGVFSRSSILYADGGFKPGLNGNRLALGPEQLVVAGFDEYSAQKYNLGIDETIHIPSSIEKLDSNFKTIGKNTIAGKVNVITGKDIRILFQQFGSDNLPRRSWGGAPPNGKKMDEFLKIVVRQEKKIIPSSIQYDKMIWCGLSWAAAEVKSSSFDSHKPLEIQCSSTEPDNLILKAEVYATIP